jgi:hypothetical protein
MRKVHTVINNYNNKLFSTGTKEMEFMVNEVKNSVTWLMKKHKQFNSSFSFGPNRTLWSIYEGGNQGNLIKDEQKYINMPWTALHSWLWNCVTLNIYLC